MRGARTNDCPMDGGFCRGVQRWIVAILAPALTMCATPAAAAPPAPCHAYPVADQSFETLRDKPEAWTCDDSNWSTKEERALLRFALGANGVVPDRLITRLARFKAIRIGIERADRTVDWRPVDVASFRPHSQMEMAAPLPQAGTPAREVVVEFSGTTVPGQLSFTNVENGSLGSFGRDELYLAALCGLLVAPLLFNLAFYRILRERFLLWHALVVCCMLGQIVASSGLAQFLVGIPVGVIFYLVITTFCGGTAAAMMLATRFIERDKLDRIHRRALRLTAAWIMVNCALFMAFVDQLQQIAVQLFYLGWLPVVVVTVWTMRVAAQRGSRAVWYQIAAWAPMMLTGVVRIVAGLLNVDQPDLFFRAQDAAISIEVIVISMGIIDRFVGLQRDLDRHRSRASRLEQLAERDPLTGLLNRRAIEPRFVELRAKGFTTLALIDLDRFKPINDQHGHAVGDHVLQAVARALAPDDDTMAMRLGGEEFILLLRGRDAVRRAEAMRRAIPGRVASDVSGLDQLVTASMGLVEIPAEVMPDASFAAIYARADGLLYQAKRGGRNRTVSERLAAFGTPPRRRKSDVAAA